MLQQRGMQQGMQLGEEKFLLRLLRRKFKQIPASIEANIRNATDEQLFGWGEAALFAETIEEVFA
jgi:hypothetical protein